MVDLKGSPSLEPLRLQCRSEFEVDVIDYVVIFLALLVCVLLLDYKNTLLANFVNIVGVGGWTFLVWEVLGWMAFGWHIDFVWRLAARIHWIDVLSICEIWLALNIAQGKAKFRLEFGD